MMSLEARGAYAILFCELWDQPEPGVVPDDDRLLASLARATPEEWGRIANDVRRAFDAQERPGYLIQRGLVATVKAQDRFIASQSHAGHVAAKARWANEKMRRASEPHPTPNANDVTPSVLGSRFSGSVLGESEEKDKTARSAHAFKKPTIAQVTVYTAERANAGHHPVDPDRWLAYYESNGWRVGRNPMRDWKAAVRTWEKNGFDSNGNGQVIPVRKCLQCHAELELQGPDDKRTYCRSCLREQSLRNELGRIPR